MAVSIDDLLKDLVSDEVRQDLQTIAKGLGLTIPTSPGEPGYQLVDMLGRWGTKIWNTWAVQALRAQFYEFASGDWLTLRARGDGVNRGLATFASGPITLENRSGNFYDVSAPGAVQIPNLNGKTFSSTGPAPGSSGTLAIWPGGLTPFPQTVLLFQADEVGTASNTTADSLPSFPAVPSSAPPGVYVVPVHGALLGSDGESDDALKVRARVRPAEEAPVATVDKYASIALSTLLPGGQPVAVSRVRVSGGNAQAIVWLATPSGPATGDTATPGTDVYEINARLQRLCGSPGLTITVNAASPHTINCGTITLYVTKASNVTASAATLTAQGALNDWTSKVPIGGYRKVAGGTGSVFPDEVLDIAKSRLSVVKGGSPYETAPGVFAADMPSFVTRIDLGPGEVAIFAFTIAVVIVDQGA